MNPIRISELDFDSILANLKSYLQAQEEFTDYDFDGAGLSILLKILAYNTHYGAFYDNMVANEMFLDSAVLAKSVYAHAKALNYLPSSRTAARATVDLSLTTSNSYVSASFTLPKFQQFVSESIDGVNYSFVAVDSYSATRANSTDVFELDSVSLAQGEPIVVRYTVNDTTNPRLRYEIPSANADISTLTVQVQESSSNTLTNTYERNTDITSVDANSKVYFLDKAHDGNYTVYFGDGVLGQRPNNGNILIFSYVVTSGAASNKARYFTMLPLANVAAVSVTTANVAAGGSEQETVESIKISAPIYYTTQNRAVTKSDYEVIIKKDFPTVASVSVWGGEENQPPIYGKVYVALNPRSGYVISESDKELIVNQLIENRVSLSVRPEIIDPEYVYVKLKINSEYDKSLTQQTKSQIETAIQNAVLEYSTTDLGLFGSKFVLSQLARAVDDSDPSIIGNEIKVYLEKRFFPVIGTGETHMLNFNTELKRGSILEKLESSAFQMLDNEGITRTAYIEETPLSYTGIDDIVITNPGIGYLAAPTVVITGDGTGAAATAKIVNGRVQSITVTDKGQDYTTAIVTLESTNNGTGALAKPIISARYGTLRVYYYNALRQKIIISPNAGTIDYASGQVILNNFNVQSYSGHIALWIRTEDPIIESARGNILTVDSTDSTAIIINLTETD